jgi:gluconolactonase
MRTSVLVVVLTAIGASELGCSEESGSTPPGSGGKAGSGASSGAGTGGIAAGGGSGTGGDGTGATSGSGGGIAGSGGATTGGTGGGAGAGGGQSGSGGNAGTGGAPNLGFVCPSGSESIAVTLPANAGSALPGIPPSDGFGGENLEGPVWIDGALYASEIRFFPQPNPGRILKIDASGVPSLFIPQQMGGAEPGTNGLAVDSQGRLFGAVQKDGSISRFDLANPAATPVPIASTFNGIRFNSPNDLALRSDGNIYFSDPNYQAPSMVPQPEERVYRIDPSGVVTALSRSIDVPSGDPRFALPRIDKPNGVTLSKDENALYVGGTGGLYKFTVMTDGSVAGGTRLNAINGGVDGMGKDCAGNLYVTNGQSVAVLGPNDMSLGSISAGANVTNVAFGGAESKTLFITSLQPAALRRVELNVPGYPY